MGNPRAKIACSINAELLARVERLRARTGESRSSLIGRALSTLTEEGIRAARVRRYIQTYQENPESKTAVRAARQQAHRVLAELAWDDE